MADKAKPSWAFLTNHGTVLLALVGNPSMEIGELAQLVGVGEQSAQEIVADLVAEGYLVPTQEDGRDGYAINGTAHLRHPLFKNVEIGALVHALRERGEF